MRRQLVLAFLACFLALECKAEELKPPFKVAAILALTGPSASFGEATKNGMLLAYDNLPEDLRSKFELLFEDDLNDSKNTLSAFAKLTGEQEIAAVVTVSSGTSNALAPVAETKQIPMLAVATDPAVVKNRNWVVNYWITPETQVGVLIPEAERRCYKKIARITSLHSFPLSTKNAFDAGNNGRFQIVLDDEYPPDAMDFRTFVTKLKARKDVDAVLVSVYFGQAGPFAKQVRQQGVSLPLFGFEIFEDSAEIKASDGALVGQWYVNGDDPTAAFTAQYKKRFPLASEYAAPNGHDIVLALAQAIKQARTRKDINDYLHTMKDFTGALGTYSASGDNRFTLPGAVKVVTKNGFEKVPPQDYHCE